MSKLFGLKKATNRNTECHWLNLHGVRILISYETPVAFDTYSERYRLKNFWGPTTGRHLRETGADDWELIDDHAEFGRLLDQALVKNMLRDRAFVEKMLVEATTNTITTGDVMGVTP